MPLYNKEAVKVFADQHPLDCYVETVEDKATALFNLCVVAAKTGERIVVLQAFGDPGFALCKLIQPLVYNQINTRTGCERALAQLENVLDNDPDSPLAIRHKGNYEARKAVNIYRGRMENLHNLLIEWHKEHENLFIEAAEIYFHPNGLRHVNHITDSIKTIMDNVWKERAIIKATQPIISDIARKYDITLFIPEEI